MSWKSHALHDRSTGNRDMQAYYKLTRRSWRKHGQLLQISDEPMNRVRGRGASVYESFDRRDGIQSFHDLPVDWTFRSFRILSLKIERSALEHQESWENPEAKTSVITFSQPRDESRDSRPHAPLRESKTTGAKPTVRGSDKVSGTDAFYKSDPGPHWNSHRKTEITAGRLRRQA